MAQFFINRPVFAIVLSIFITLGGVIAGLNLPIAQYPDITNPQVQVSANYVGSNSEVVEQSVAQLIEQQVNGVEKMISMESTSSDNGQYTLTVKFELGVDGDMAAVQVQNRVAQANSQLPQEVISSGVTTQKVSPDTIMYVALRSPQGTYDSTFLKNYSSIYLVDDIKRINGVAQVNEYGSDFAMRIWLLPDKMAQLGISVTDVSNAIKTQNLQSPAGAIGQLPSAAGQEFQYTAQVKGRLSDPAEFGGIIVRAQPDGSFVRIRDVARVELAAKDYTFASDLNAKDATLFGVQLTPEANALDTVNKIREVIETAAKKFPVDMEQVVVIDNTLFVRESLREVVQTFAEALALVLIIVFIFLQSWRATLIPMLAIPVSLVGTFGCFVILGFSINTLTLFAMVLAIGLVVDDAIVVVEAVEHHMRFNGMKPKEATVQAMKDVSGPVVAIAFVLASVFIPVAFMGGTVGVLYKQFALTIAVSMALSAFVALTLTPSLCVLLLKPHDPNAHKGVISRFFEWFNLGIERMTEKYGSGVKFALRRSKLALVMLLVLVACTLALARVVPSTFVPDEDLGYYMATVTLPEASNLNRTRAAAQEVSAIIDKFPVVENTIAISGYDVMSGTVKSNSAVVFTGLKPWAERQTPALKAAGMIRQTYGAVAPMTKGTVMVFNPPTLSGVSGYGGISLRLRDLSGGTLENLEQVTQNFLAAARKRPEIGLIYTTFNSSTPAYRFDVDREKTEKMQVPVSDVFNALQVFLGGMQVNDMNLFGRTYKVTIQADPQFRSDTTSLRFFHLRTTNGDSIPLSTLVKPVDINGPTMIQRFNGVRAVKITGNPADGYSTGEAITALEEVMAETLPDTFGYEWADQTREEKMSGQRAPIVFGMAILFVFLCLSALYESWSIPFAVLLSVPTGIFGCFLFQHLRTLENSVYMQIGLVMLIGLAAKNAILIVEFAKAGTDRGLSPTEAAVEAAKLRLRPILMTSLAFILGCIPLAIASGAGAAARNSMGTAVVGGMLTATLFGIFIVPVLFVVVETLAAKLSRKEEKPVEKTEEH
ncbi:MAG TPA: multidrug efflux RND transporter permease subunit [Patescibacteria group bacterium]|nr:multidrug efflux RND transporter permease subunit [Patescibacteria group bacterium]